MMHLISSEEESVEDCSQSECHTVERESRVAPPHILVIVKNALFRHQAHNIIILIVLVLTFEEP